MTSAYQFRPNYTVTLSPEGKKLLQPSSHLKGTVIAVEAGLVKVRESAKVIADYHPDFLEVIGKPKPTPHRKGR